MKRVQYVVPHKLHWLLGGITVCPQSIVVLGSMILRPWPDPGGWFDPLWFALATLWFFWPIVLVLHRGRSAVACRCAACFGRLHHDAVVSNAHRYRHYRLSDCTMGCDLHPVTMTRFFGAYLRGRADAHGNSMRDGQLAIKIFLGSVPVPPGAAKRHSKIVTE